MPVGMCHRVGPQGSSCVMLHDLLPGSDFETQSESG